MCLWNLFKGKPLCRMLVQPRIGPRPNGQVRETAAWTITTKPESSRLTKASSSIGNTTEACTGMAINWVLGAVEQETGRCLLEVVANRDRAMLEPILDLWLLPGTHIISNSWAAYIHLDQLNQGVYLHLTWLSMSITLMTPSMIDCTPRQLGTCMRAKRKLQHQQETSRALFPFSFCRSGEPKHYWRAWRAKWDINWKTLFIWNK